MAETRDCGWLVAGLYDYYASTKERALVFVAFLSCYM
jgi:hypothetical protein